MRKVGASKGSAAPSPVPGSTYETSGGELMGRTNSGGGGGLHQALLGMKAHILAGPRTSSALSARKEIPVARNDAIPGTPVGRAMGVEK
ncbi:hypothetical protein M7I_7838 [Glarea lozoyensis 74030]|uniref:Uncharacterized protein n=1 Tax=Glarea lozoyensis (strain ATCC 74030 / MF5533) TaxID=1104152 RepID=H0EYD9_GLAL7|nr:hypothetical protein M7I_7838 [Glarea lozoyensis 74030]